MAETVEKNRIDGNIRELSPPQMTVQEILYKLRQSDRSTYPVWDGGAEKKLSN